MVIARIGIAARAVGQLVPDRVIVVALHHHHLALAQDRKHAVGMGAKAAEVAQTKRRLRSTALRIVEDSWQRQVVIVDAAKDGVAQCSRWCRCGQCRGQA